MMILMINQPTSTAFYMKNNFWTKISKNGHCEQRKTSIRERPLMTSDFRVGFKMTQKIGHYRVKRGTVVCIIVRRLACL